VIYCRGIIEVRPRYFVPKTEENHERPSDGLYLSLEQIENPRNLGLKQRSRRLSHPFQNFEVEYELALKWKKTRLLLRAIIKCKFGVTFKAVALMLLCPGVHVNNIPEVRTECALSRRFLKKELQIE
jgi:hypothetical protein